MKLGQEGAIALDDLLDGGALRLALDEVKAEFESRSKLLVSLDLEDPDGSAKARKLQGEIRGGLQALELLEELIHDRAHPQPAGDD